MGRRGVVLVRRRAGGAHRPAGSRPLARPRSESLTGAALSCGVGGPDVSDGEVGKRIRDELEETRRQFHALLGSLSDAEWDAPSRNSAWTNGQLVFHMLFAFMLIPSLFW